MTHPEATPGRVLVVGDLMLDHYLWGASERISPEAPVPVVDVGREGWALGGAGNVAANLRALGATVQLVSLANRDSAYDRLSGLLADLAISAKHLVADPKRPTTVKTRVMASHHQLLRFDVEQRAPVSPPVLAQLRQAIDLAIPDCDAVVLSDYGKGVLTAELCQHTIARADALHKPVIVDPKGSDYRKYRGATIVTPNRKEAALAFGAAVQTDGQLLEAGEHLRRTFALSACLITLSEDGMALFTDQGVERIATRAREVFDVTGAGDTVVAALAVGLARQEPLADACRFANLAAGVVVGKLGAATATPAEIQAFARAADGTAAESKVMTLAELEALVPALRRAGKRLVFTNGCFDILHAGHVRYLETSSDLGDILVVGVNSDASVQRLKGPDRPINAEADRLLVLAGLASVDYVVAFEEDTPNTLIEALKPDVLVKGGDYTEETIVGAPFVRSYGGAVKTVPLYEGRSTTNTIATIARTEGKKVP